MTARLPVCTAFTVALCVAVYLLPDLASLLIYDRQAIERGELWRLLTGNMVHFSVQHLAADILALAVTAGLIERLRLEGAAALFMAMPICIGAVLFLFEPGMRYYGGLSGLAYGTITYLALFGLRGGHPYRKASALALSVMASMIAWDMRSVVDPHRVAGPFVPVPLSHLAGAVTALTVFAYRASAFRYHSTKSGQMYS